MEGGRGRLTVEEYGRARCDSHFPWLINAEYIINCVPPRVNGKKKKRVPRGSPNKNRQVETSS